MDNITHTLVGLMLSRAGFDRGEKGTAVMTMLAANMPDVDVIPTLTDGMRFLEIHRGYTHSLPFVPLVALIPFLLVKWITRTKVTLISYLACVVGVLSHLLLDWTNVYGVRLLMPFSQRWFRLDATDVIDPAIWLILLSALAAPLLVSLVSSEIGSSKGSGVKRGWAWFALLALTAYDTGRWVAHDRAVSILNAYSYKGAPAREVYAFPIRFSVFGWRGVARGNGFYYEVPVNVMQSLNPSFNLSSGQYAYLPGDSPAIEAARTTRIFRVFENFNQVPFWRISPILDGTKVELIDLRFGSTARPAFEAVANLDKDGRVIDSHFTFGD